MWIVGIKTCSAQNFVFVYEMSLPRPLLKYNYFICCYIVYIVYIIYNNYTPSFLVLPLTKYVRTL